MKYICICNVLLSRGNVQFNIQLVDRRRTGKDANLAKIVKSRFILLLSHVAVTIDRENRHFHNARLRQKSGIDILYKTTDGLSVIR